MYIFINKSEIEVISLGVEYLSVVSLGTRVILAYILASTWLSERGIWCDIPIGWALADIIGIVYYQKKINL